MAAELFVTAHYTQDADALFEKASSFADMVETSPTFLTFGDLPALPMVQCRTYETKLDVFGLFKTNDYAIRIDTLSPTRRRVQSSAKGKGVKTWNHTLDVIPDAEGCVWTDQISIDAGRKTPIYARYARFVYLHRHKRRGATSITSTLRKSDVELLENGIFHARD